MESNSNFTPLVLRILKGAREKAQQDGFRYVHVEHVFLELMSSYGSSVNHVLQTHLDTQRYIDVCKKNLTDTLTHEASRDMTQRTTYSKETYEVVSLAKEYSSENHNDYVGGEHLILGLLNANNKFSEALRQDKNFKKLANAVQYDINISIPAQQKETVGAPAGHNNPKGKNNSFLEMFGTNLNKLASSGQADPVIGRTPEIDRCVRILCRKNKNCPVLVGDAGVGKTAIAYGIAQKIVSGEVPRTLSKKEVYEIDLGLMVAGTKYRGQFEERLKKLMHEVKQKGNIIVFIDELHTIIGAGGAEGAIDASNILKPALARGDFSCIGATTIDEHRRYIEKDGALDRRFQKVTVSKPTTDEAVEMLRGVRRYYEKFHNVKINDEILSLCVELSEQFIHGRNLPDKAFDVLDEACVLAISSASGELKPAELSELRLIRDKKEQAIQQKRYNELSVLNDLEKKVAQKRNRAETPKPLAQNVLKKFVFRVVSDISRIPLDNVSQSFSGSADDLKTALSDGLVGQDDAVKLVYRCLLKSKTPLKDAYRPIGSFLFVGKTGVGKTFLAKNIAKAMFGNQDALITFDMSEYQTRESINKLLGGSPSYVGYEEGGQLINAVRRNPYSVVLFDEVEKAHPEVLQLFLHILEEGRVTDGKGKEACFKNCIVIFTSNIGSDVDSETTKSTVGFGGELPKEPAYTEQVTKKCKDYFAPEFLNRLNSLVVFNKLAQKIFKDIVTSEYERLIRKLSSNNIQIKLSDKVLNFLAKKGFSEEYGAREVRRIFESEIEDRLIDDFINGEIKKGSLVSFDVKRGKISHLIS